MNFTRALAKAGENDDQLEGHVVAARSLLFDSGFLNSGDRSFELDDRGMKRLCQRVKAPAAYLQELPGCLQNALIQHHLGREMSQAREVEILATGTNFVGFGRADLVRLSGREVMLAVYEATGRSESDLDVVNFRVDIDSLRFDLIAHTAQREVVPGDAIEAGVRVQHSLIGAYATTIEGYMLRLVCQNGMVHRECVGSRRTPRTRRLLSAHRGAKLLQLDQVKRLTATRFSQIEAKLGGLSRLTTEPAVFNQLAENWLSRARLSTERLLPELREAWHHEGAEPTVYGVVNAFTRVATHSKKLTDHQRDVLSRLGALLAFRHQHLCPRCWSLISSDVAQGSGGDSPANRH